MEELAAIVRDEHPTLSEVHPDAPLPLAVAARSVPRQESGGPVRVDTRSAPRSRDAGLCTSCSPVAGARQGAGRVQRARPPGAAHRTGHRRRQGSTDRAARLGPAGHVHRSRRHRQDPPGACRWPTNSRSQFDGGVYFARAVDASRIRPWCHRRSPTPWRSTSSQSPPIDGPQGAPDARTLHASADAAASRQLRTPARRGALCRGPARDRGAAQDPGHQPGAAASVRRARGACAAAAAARSHSHDLARHAGAQSGGHAVRGAGDGVQARLRADQRERARDCRDLQPARRLAAGHRAGGGPRQDAASGGDARAAGEPSPDPDRRRTGPARASADAARGDRLEPRPARRGRTAAVPPPVGLHRRLHVRGGRGRGRHETGSRRRRHRRHRVAGEQEPAPTERASGRREPADDDGDGPGVRARTTGGERRGCAPSASRTRRTSSCSPRKPPARSRAADQSVWVERLDRDRDNVRAAHRLAAPRDECRRGACAWRRRCCGIGSSGSCSPRAGNACPPCWRCLRPPRDQPRGRRPCSRRPCSRPGSATTSRAPSC